MKEGTPHALCPTLPLALRGVALPLGGPAKCERRGGEHLAATGSGRGAAGLIIHEVEGEDRNGEAASTRLIPGDGPCDSRPTQPYKPSRLCSE
ncbi:hypothetical protein E2C01_005189 [Portunus trituberculatus]|uniref:Uncharacterized protein n=1 Tax=Portunus trituberculatus TaxID=210409 RepID=A0A5B7CSN6_PORTR|nr:hypothetical protein [Portunus trituberculatus]